MEVFAYWVIVAIVTAVVASSRGRSALGWFVLGFALNLLALIAVVVLPSLSAVDGRPTPATHVICPDCREYVRKDARKCRFCGCSLKPQ